MYSEFWSKISAMLVFVGFNLTFFPQFILGYMGMPRRYASYPPELQVLNIFSTAGASILAIGLIMPLIYFTYSIFFGRESSGKSVASARTRMAHIIAAADRKF